MELESLWFVLVAVLFAGFFCLEGFDYGVGMLMPFAGRNQQERNRIMHTIAPFWHGNQVWMITAGGALFAAFPHVYATLFSGFYLALFLMLLALIVRGCAFEFRNMREDEDWRTNWDICVFVGSFVPALLWGVAVSNLLRGVAIDQRMQYIGGFFDLLNVYALIGGVTFVLLFVYHGGLYALLRVDGLVAAQLRRVLTQISLPVALVAAAYAAATYYSTDLFAKWPAAVTLILALVLFLISRALLLKECYGKAFVFSSLTIIAVTAALFGGLYPRLIVSSLNPAWSLTVSNAASSQTTLKLMTIAAFIFVPLVLLYQGWVYWLLRGRTAADDAEY